MKRSPWKITGLVGLALVCILGAELAVCRVAEPALFEKLTRPAVEAAQGLAQWGGGLAEGLRQPEETPVDQRASDPALPTDRPVEDPKITEFATHQDGEEVLLGGSAEVVYFNQSEAPWASQPYGPDEVGGYGCGPACMAMLVSTLTEKTMDPAEMAAWAYENGYCAPGSGSYCALITGTAEAYGLTVQPFRELTADALTEALASGHLFAALMTRGHFTSGGHFILLRGVTLEGKILVADPNSRERSLTAWDPELILGELSSTRSAGAPLWQFDLLSHA